MVTGRYGSSTVSDTPKDARRSENSPSVNGSSGRKSARLGAMSPSETTVAISGAAHEVDAERCAPAVPAVQTKRKTVQETRARRLIRRGIGKPSAGPQPSAGR